jgi:hypothetical protein
MPQVRIAPLISLAHGKCHLPYPSFVDPDPATIGHGPLTKT